MSLARVTSAGTARTRLPARPSNAAASSSRPASREHMATFAPISERLWAIAKPIPRLAPVTSATLFSRDFPALIGSIPWGDRSVRFTILTCMCGNKGLARRGSKWNAFMPGDLRAPGASPIIRWISLCPCAMRVARGFWDPGLAVSPKRVSIQEAGK